MTCTNNIECVRRDTIRAMDANATNAVLGANSAIAFKQRGIFVEVKLINVGDSVFNH